MYFSHENFTFYVQRKVSIFKTIFYTELNVDYAYRNYLRYVVDRLEFRENWLGERHSLLLKGTLYY